MAGKGNKPNTEASQTSAKKTILGCKREGVERRDCPYLDVYLVVVFVLVMWLREVRAAPGAGMDHSRPRQFRVTIAMERSRPEPARIHGDGRTVWWETWCRESRRFR